MEDEQQEREAEAERERRDKLQEKRETTFQSIVKNAPAAFSADQLRVLLRALVNLDPYTFADDLAVEFTGDDENDQRSADEVLLAYGALRGRNPALALANPSLACARAKACLWGTATV